MKIKIDGDIEIDGSNKDDNPNPIGKKSALSACFELIGLFLLATTIVLGYRILSPEIIAGMKENRCQNLAELQIYDPECL